MMKKQDLAKLLKLEAEVKKEKKQELLEALAKCQKNLDAEERHIVADELLLDYIDDEEIARAFCAINKWYA